VTGIGIGGGISYGFGVTKKNPLICVYRKRSPQISHCVESVIKPELHVRVLYSEGGACYGVEVKSFICGQDMLSNQGRIMWMVFLGGGCSIGCSWGVGLQSFFTKELQEGSVISTVDLYLVLNMGMEFILGNFSLSPEISVSREFCLGLNGRYYYFPEIKSKMNPREKKIAYITTGGGTLCGLAKPLLLSALSGKRLPSNAYYYYPLLIEGGICGYLTGKLLSSWIKKDEKFVSSVAKGACSGLLGGTASFIMGMASYHISRWGEFSYSKPSLVFLVNVTNISLWTISGAIYGAIASGIK
jgi:hypothetical protein